MHLRPRQRRQDGDPEEGRGSSVNDSGRSENVRCVVNVVVVSETFDDGIVRRVCRHHQRDQEKATRTFREFSSRQKGDEVFRPGVREQVNKAKVLVPKKNFRHCSIFLSSLPLNVQGVLVFEAFFYVFGL